MRGKNRYLILAINPGSTSTKTGIFENETEIFMGAAIHSLDELARYPDVLSQCELRKKAILKDVTRSGIDFQNLDSVVGRGGFLRPMPSGTYKINDKMLKDLREGKYGVHASNLGGILAWSIAEETNAEAFIVDPVVVDELTDIARISGMPEIRRKSVFHVLNHKAVARFAARELGKPYNELNLIVVHLGGGITVGAHKRGKVVDVNDGLNGDGPFSPTRSGGLPVLEVIELLLSSKYKADELRRRVMREGGVSAYLGTNDMRKVKRLVERGHRKAKLIYEAMAYQVAKEIGSCGVVLEGNVDAIVVTGGIARDHMFVDLIKRRISFISKVLVYPGGDELKALAMGALEVLRREKIAKEY